MAKKQARVAPPQLTLFTKTRPDTSMKAQAARQKGTEAPSFFGKDPEMPEDVRELLAALAGGPRK